MPSETMTIPTQPDGQGEERGMEWRPIETAPKDGTEILAMVKYRVGFPHRMVIHWAHGGGEDQPRFGPAWFYWCGSSYAEIEYATILSWHPLPDPPKAGA